MGNCLMGSLQTCDDSVEYFSFNGQIFEGKVIKVFDGDTLSIVVRFHGDFIKLRVRLLGYDSAEKNSENQSEREAGLLATHTLKNLVENKTVTLHCKQFDLHGRVLGYIYLDTTAVNQTTKCKLSCCNPTEAPLLVNDFMLHNVKGCVPYAGGNRRLVRQNAEYFLNFNTIQTLDACKGTCSCRGQCNTKRCSCFKQNKKCTPYCHIGGSKECQNSTLERF